MKLTRKYKNTQESINKELDNELFRQHCAETAKQLGIAPEVVEDVIKDKAHQIIRLLFESLLARIPINIRVIGWFSLKSINRKYIIKLIKIKNKWKVVSR